MRNFSSVNAVTYKSNRKQVFQVMQAAHCYCAQSGFRTTDKQRHPGLWASIIFASSIANTSPQSKSRILPAINTVLSQSSFLIPSSLELQRRWSLRMRADVDRLRDTTTSLQALSPDYRTNDMAISWSTCWSSLSSTFPASSHISNPRSRPYQSRKSSWL